MKAFTLTSFGLALSAALGALASPASPGSLASNDLDVRSKNDRYPGTCDPNTNQCHYKTHSGLKAICRCDFKRCTDAIEKKECYFDSYSRKCVC
ncbi:hypothetical protein BDV26DRAFT_264055 [Aspergillus bertholletiae]|uniref:Antifungal protein n=1 Tax=Aspergillus bertholletiae TaxID=1226010 RepID=A0A5N7B703_9EURO|nr:hypothetical protein BDV26DRAFT_264055 [Aspergillus bertholletiae]